MDPETLRTLLEVFSQATGEAKEMFIWYLVVAYVPGYILGGIGIWAATWAVKELINCGRGYIAGERLREAAGVGWSWDASELNRAVVILHEHYPKNQK